MECLEKNPGIFYNRLLWDIAFERNEIDERHRLSAFLESGYINRAFKENFRRAVSRLEETKRVRIEKRKITDLDEAFNYFPYHTDRLDILQLRNNLLPTLREYILEEKPRKFGSPKIEEKLIEEIKKDQKYNILRSKWIAIEKKILTVLDPEKQSHDKWMQLLIRGRYLFASDSISHHRSLTDLHNVLLRSTTDDRVEEIGILDEIRNLMRFAFDWDKWKLGEIKAVYYDLAHFGKYGKERLKDDVKDALLRKQEQLIVSLPNHQEPKSIVTARGRSWGHIGPRKYSEYLDKLITRQILREQKILFAVNG